MTFTKTMSLEMGNEAHYREKANSYRSSPEYGKMVALYPILKTSINDCKGESLIN